MHVSESESGSEQENSISKGEGEQGKSADPIGKNKDPKAPEIVQIGPFRYDGLEGITITKI